MTQAKYNTAEHKQARKDYTDIVAAGLAQCAEVRCLLPSRTIIPGQVWHVAHDPSGTVIIGVSHMRCNTSEAGARGNRMRAKRKAWRL